MKRNCFIVVQKERKQRGLRKWCCKIGLTSVEYCWDTVLVMKKESQGHKLHTRCLDRIEPFSAKLLFSTHFWPTTAATFVVKWKQNTFYALRPLLSPGNVILLCNINTLLLYRSFCSTPPVYFRVNLAVLSVPGQLSAFLPGSRHKHNSP